MTRLVRFSNNAVSQLAANLTISGTSLSVVSGDGAKFPSLSGTGQYFMATLVKADGSTEVVKVTARATDTFTIVRAAEPVAGASTSYSFSAGDRIEARLTAGVLGDEIDRLDNGAITEAINKSANYTLVEADVTKLVRVNTASGTTTITLPDTSTLTDDYDVIVAKVTGDANTVVIARTGSTDLINGASSYTIYNQWQSAWLIADRSTNTWTVISSGMSAVNTVVNSGTGDGSTANITLSGDPGSKNNIILVIGGVYQQKATYSISGTTLTAGATIPNGVAWEAVWSAPLTIGTPSDGTVSTVKLADGALAATTAGLAKMADGFLQATTAGLAKMADGFLAATTAGRAKMADGFITPAKMQNGGAEFGMVNRIINGRMEVDQLNTAAGAMAATDGGYQLDMYQTFTQTGEGAFTVQKVADAPAGYLSSAKITVTTADASIGASQRYLFLHNIEGKDIADLNFGSANAQAVTVSFWAKSSVTGSHSGTLMNAGFTRSYPFNITINSANTWEQKFINIAGETTGTWFTDNNVGMRVVFDLGSGTSQRGAANAWGTVGFGVTGAVSLISTVNATMNITGLDIRKGTYTSAPPADWRPYGAELALCQRYAFKLDPTNAYQRFGLGETETTVSAKALISYPVTMRSSSVSLTIPAASNFAVYSANSLTTCNSVALGVTSAYNAEVNFGVASGLTPGRAAQCIANGTTAAYMLFTSRL